MNDLIARLEALDYLFVTVVEDNLLTAVDPQGFQVHILVDGDTVYDRSWSSEFWDIMFIGDESFL